MLKVGTPAEPLLIFYLVCMIIDKGEGLETEVKKRRIKKA